MRRHLPVLPEPSPPEAAPGPTRREFLGRLGGSLAIAGVMGCVEPPREKILPFSRPPDVGRVGQALHYTALWPEGGLVEPLVVRTREGRPIKVEGNPDFGFTGGGTSAAEQ